MVAGRTKVRSHPPKIRERGFTLVEVLIAIFIFAIVIGTVYGSYRATFHIINGSESRLTVANSARIVVDRLSADLGSVVTGPGGQFHGERHDYSGARGDSLLFVSSAHLVLSKADTFLGYSMIQYQIEPEEKTGLFDLYRSDVVLLPGTEADNKDAKKYLICRGLQEFRFTYLGQDGNEAEEWQVDEVKPPVAGVAPQESPFPVLVYVELKFADSEGSENSTVFKTAIALPLQWKKQG